MEELLAIIGARYNYWVYVVLMMIGLFAIISKNNFVKKIIGMNIFQTSIILFYVSTAFKTGKSIPIISHGHGHEAVVAHAADYINPLPHVLMLTAIVVSVATLGVALALAIKTYKAYGTLEEDDINNQLRSEAGK
jgi:multicomponent Na+:H+ antiporter subunit C